jgi:hypothetical protein
MIKSSQERKKWTVSIAKKKKNFLLATDKKGRFTRIRSRPFIFQNYFLICVHLIFHLWQK